MQNKKEMAAYGVVAFVFMFFQLACRALEVQENVNWNVRSILMCVGISIGFAAITVFVLWAVNKWMQKVFGRKNIQKQQTSTKTQKVFWISWAVIFVCWLPVFLAYYPGILAYDSYVQIEQILKKVIWNKIMVCLKIV